MNTRANVVSSVRRATFLGGAAVLAVASPAGAYMRPTGPCDDPAVDPDVDLKWYTEAADDANGNYKEKTQALRMSETEALGLKLATLVLADGDFRNRYHNLVRTWKKKWFDPKNGKKGGKYGVAYIALLEEKLNPPRPLELDDIANLHRYAFLVYRRAVLALTGHDIDPDALKPIVTRSFHFGPNDGSSATFAPAQLGFTETLP